MCRGFECTSHLKEEGKIKLFSCEIECEKPNENLNEFTGTLITENENEKMRKKIGLSYYHIERNFLECLCGCSGDFLVYLNYLELVRNSTLNMYNKWKKL